jgi:phage tail-like protein
VALPENVHPFTVRWWAGLPQTYRKYDGTLDYQLLRFMDGMGSVAGDVEDITFQMFDGTIMDPERTPDGALRWLSMLMGLPVAQRQGSPEALREVLVSLVENGRPPVGTRAGVAEAVKRFLTGDKQVYAVPTPGEPYVISVLVRLDEVPGADLAALKEKIMALGVIPAGHTVSILEAISIWEDWDNMTWAQKDTAIKTWVDATSHGVQL